MNILKRFGKFFHLQEDFQCVCVLCVVNNYEYADTDGKLFIKTMRKWLVCVVVDYGLETR